MADPFNPKTFGLSVECSSNSFDANDIMTEDDIHPSQKTNSSQLERVPNNGAPGPQHRRQHRRGPPLVNIKEFARLELPRLELTRHFATTI